MVVTWGAVIAHSYHTCIDMKVRMLMGLAWLSLDSATPEETYPPRLHFYFTIHSDMHDDAHPHACLPT